MSLFRSFTLFLAFLCLLASNSSGQDQISNNRPDQPLRITSQPKAVYTERARKKGIQGSVRLKVALLATGEVGAVTLVKTKGWQKLEKYGLAANAISAAKQIQFTPKVVNGVPVSVVVTREYTFTIY